MTQRGSWMVIYPLFKWSRGFRGGKPVLASGLPPESNHLQPVRGFDNFVLCRFAKRCICTCPSEDRQATAFACGMTSSGITRFRLKNITSLPT